jgi:lysozyme
MRCNEKGRHIIKEFEGLRLDGYRCPAGVATVGYGHTGPDVRIPMTITPGEAERLLDKDIARFEAVLNAMLNGSPTSEDEFSAMISLMFNIGPGRFATSTLLKRHKAGNKTGAANSFLSWVFAGGKKLKGLMRRREAERALYLGEYA